jgi:hypothetical protein
MALNDFVIVDGGGTTQPTRKFYVRAGTTVINPGEPVIVDAGNPNYVIAAPNGASSTSVWAGAVAASTSDQTASADGSVFVYDDPNMVIRGKAKVKANLTTAILLDKVVLSLVGGVYTVDESTVANGVLRIVDFDATNGTVDFKLARSARYDN